MDDAKSNVLDLSKEPIEIILRLSMLEEPREHAKITFLQEYASSVS
jgi:hypothetical protein